MIEIVHFLPADYDEVMALWSSVEGAASWRGTRGSWLGPSWPERMRAEGICSISR
jgi:hypothetical protein